MKFNNKYKWLIIVILMLLIYISFLLCIANKKRSSKESKNEIYKETININTFEIKNRIKLIKNNKLYIGENLKELENDFYDIKISTLDSGLEVTLNKLWRYEVNKEYIEDDYLIEIVDQIVELLGIENVKEDVNYELYKYIKQNFLKVKNNEQVEPLELEEFNVCSKSIDGECVIYIERK